MTREIEYRQFVNGKMVYSGFEMCGSFVMPNVNISIYPIMQYTGIKDKNGVKIFEGDVVRSASAIGFVSFVSGSFTINWSSHSVIGSEVSGIGVIPMLGSLEVIGNIHEEKE